MAVIEFLIPSHANLCLEGSFLEYQICFKFDSDGLRIWVDFLECALFFHCSVRSISLQASWFSAVDNLEKTLKNPKH